MNLNKMYDQLMELQRDLEQEVLQATERLPEEAVSALAATFELQDYLAHKIAEKKIRSSNIKGVSNFYWLFFLCVGWVNECLDHVKQLSRHILALLRYSMFSLTWPSLSFGL